MFAAKHSICLVHNYESLKASRDHVVWCSLAFPAEACAGAHAVLPPTGSPEPQQLGWLVRPLQLVAKSVTDLLLNASNWAFGFYKS